MSSGFEKCGIHPFNPIKVLERLPDYNKETPDQEEIQANVSTAVIDILKDLRGVNEQVTRRKKRKINVPAGQSIAIDDIRAEEEAATATLPDSDSDLSYEQEADDEEEEEENETVANEAPIEIIPAVGKYM